MKKIDITPTWSALIIPMVEVLKNPKAPAEAKKEITDEFVRLAKIVDERAFTRPVFPQKSQDFTRMEKPINE